MKLVSATETPSKNAMFVRAPHMSANIDANPHAFPDGSNARYIIITYDCNYKCILSANAFCAYNILYVYVCNSFPYFILELYNLGTAITASTVLVI